VVSIEIAADGAWSLRGSLRGIHGAPRNTSRQKLGTLGFPSCARLPGTRRPGLLAALPPALDRLQSGGLIDTIAGDYPLHAELHRQRLKGGPCPVTTLLFTVFHNLQGASDPRGPYSPS
jgi:hypothetical protein